MNSLVIAYICALSTGLLVLFTLVLNSMFLMGIAGGLLIMCVGFGIVEVVRDSIRDTHEQRN